MGSSINTSTGTVKNVRSGETGNGTAYLGFTVHVSRKYIDKNGDTQASQVFIPCIAWGNQTQLLTGLGDGDRVLVSGDEVSSKNKDEDGNERWERQVKIRDGEILVKAKPKDDGVPF